MRRGLRRRTLACRPATHPETRGASLLPIRGKGTLITFEGIDGCGKSTQLYRLGERLLEEYPSRVVLVREPGGTVVGEQIRALFLQLGQTATAISGRTEALLFQAARAELYSAVIAPTLAEGKIVLSDRGPDSSTVFQGVFMRFGDIIAHLNRFATFDVKPDCTILIDTPVDVALARQDARGKKTHIDSWPRSAHEAIRQSYLQLAEFEARWHILDGNRSEDAVAADVWQLVAKHLAGRGFTPNPSTPSPRRAASSRRLPKKAANDRK